MYELRDITPERRERRQGDEFVATMTHDLKSPLTVMLGYADCLARDNMVIQSSRAVESLEEMRRSGHRLLAMIEDILDSYRLDAGLVQIRRGFCDFGKDLASCCSELRHDADMHNVRLEYRIDPDIPVFKIDSAQICRVFSNLVGNAIKFTPSGGKVSVDAVFAGKELVVTVADTGIGISAKDQAKIFGKYFRSDRVKGYKGTGLGLTIAKALVEAHGGSIQVASSEDAGSCFTVTLPVQLEP
jgi:signal transduction histidine kinase